MRNRVAKWVKTEIERNKPECYVAAPSPPYSLTPCRTHFRGLSGEGAGGGLRRRCSHSLWFPLDVSLCLVISSCGVFVVHPATPCEKVGGRRLCLRRFIKISKNFGKRGGGLSRDRTTLKPLNPPNTTQHHPPPNAQGQWQVPQWDCRGQLFTSISQIK